VLVLRAEHDDLRVSINPHIVPRRPVEEVSVVAAGSPHF
jgi:hypothetical protein